MAKDDKIRRMQEIERQKQRLFDKNNSRFLSGLDKSLRKLNDKIPGLIKDFETKNGRFGTGRDNLLRAQNTRRDIEELLLSSGFKDNTEGLVRSYEDVARFTADALKAGGLDARFTNTDIEALESLRDLDLKRWGRFGDDIVDVVHSNIMDSVISGAPFDDLVSDISDLLGPKGRFPGRAQTLANTISQGFDRTVTNRKADQSGVTTFVYLGPSDSLTRPFCRALLAGGSSSEFSIPSKESGVYTRAEIDKMSNGQGLRVSQYAGGYNCRHKFRPISVKDTAEV